VAVPSIPSTLPPKSVSQGSPSEEGKRPEIASNKIVKKATESSSPKGRKRQDAAVESVEKLTSSRALEEQDFTPGPQRSLINQVCDTFICAYKLF